MTDLNNLLETEVSELNTLLAKACQMHCEAEKIKVLAVENENNPPIDDVNPP